MEIITEKINDKEVQLILVKIDDPYTKKKKIYKFKEFKVDEFNKVKMLQNTDTEEGTMAIVTKPVQYMINAMMIEGEKVDGNTNLSVLNKLKKELADFLS